MSPLSIEDILKNSDLKTNINDSNTEYKEVKAENHISTGMFKRGTSTVEGIARRVFAHTQIQEGQFSNSKLNGYARTYY